MKRLLAFLALCLPIYLFAQGFGSFTHDQPYFAKDASGGGGVPPPDTAYLFGWWIAGSNVFQAVDGTDATTNGSFAKYWGDVGGNNYNFTNSSGGPMLVTNIINGLPIMYFGTNNYPLLFGIESGGPGEFPQPYWIFMVAKRGSVNNADEKIIMQTAAGYPSFTAQTAPQGYTYAGGAGHFFNGFPLNSVMAYGLLYSNDQSYVFTNGVATTPSQIGSANATYTRVGGAGNSDRMFHGGIAEFFIYTNFLSSNSIWKANNYMMNKYYGTNAP